MTGTNTIVLVNGTPYPCKVRISEELMDDSMFDLEAFMEREITVAATWGFWEDITADYETEENGKARAGG